MTIAVNRTTDSCPIEVVEVFNRRFKNSAGAKIEIMTVEDPSSAKKHSTAAKEVSKVIET